MEGLVLKFFMDYSQEILKNKYASLPSDVKNAISSVDTFRALEGVAKKYSLHIDKLDELTQEVGFVMLGLTNPEDFLKNLAARLEISETTAGEIEREINEQIFSPIR